MLMMMLKVEVQIQGVFSFEKSRSQSIDNVEEKRKERAGGGRWKVE